MGGSASLTLSAFHGRFFRQFGKKVRFILIGPVFAGKVFFYQNMQSSSGAKREEPFHPYFIGFHPMKSHSRWRLYTDAASMYGNGHVG